MVRLTLMTGKRSTNYKLDTHGETSCKGKPQKTYFLLVKRSIYFTVEMRFKSGLACRRYPYRLL